MNKISAINLVVVLCACIFSANIMNAQLVSGSAYIPGNFVNVGIDGNGGFEGVNTLSAAVPAGLHFRSNTDFFGYTANPQQDGWVDFDGDFFTPGTPENGWGFQILDGATNIVKGNNCNYINEIPGSITLWEQIGDCYIVVWDGDYVEGSRHLHFKVTYNLGANNLYYTTTVMVKNMGTVAIPEFYYYRNVDPDNNVTINGSDYETTNTIVSQSTSGGGCNLSHVSATQSNPWNSYLGFAGIGSGFRVCHGGFSNSVGSDLWNGVGFEQTVGSSILADNAMSISYKATNLPVNGAETFSYVVILSDDAALNAVNSLFFFNYPGGVPSNQSLCSNPMDTVNICSGSTLPLSITGNALSSFSWVWTPSTGLSTTTGPTVDASPSVGTLYTVTGTPLSACFDEVTQQIFVDVSSETINLSTTSATMCQYESVDLSVSGGSTYTWSPDYNLSTTSGSTVTASPDSTTTYYVSATGTSGCIANSSVLVTVVEEPVLTISGNNICLGESVTLQASGSTGYVWTPNPTLSATTGSTVIATPTTTTTYYVAAGIGSCQGDTSIQIIVSPKPSITVSDTTICSGASVNLTMVPSAAGGTFHWTPGGNTNNIPVTPLTTTTYLANYDIFDCYADEQEMTITVVPTPHAGFDVEDVCFGNTAQFEDESTGLVTTYNYNFDDASPISHNASPNHNYASVGDYMVTQEVIYNGCSNSITLPVHVNEYPVASFTMTPNCQGTASPLVSTSTTVTDPIGTYHWTLAGATTPSASGSSTSAQYASGGLYNIELLVTTTEGCSDSLTQQIYIRHTPVADFTYNNVCEGTDNCFDGTVTIPAGTIVDWEYDFDDSQSSNLVDDCHHYSSLGAYNVSFRALSDEGCWSAPAVHAVNVYPIPPTPSFTVLSQTGCTPLCISFDNQTGAIGVPVNYEWSVDGVLASTDEEPTQCFYTLEPNGERFDITLTAMTGTGCSKTITEYDYITVYPLPDAILTVAPLSTSILEPDVTFSSQSYLAYNTTWDFGDGQSSTDLLVTHTYAEAGYYDARLIVTSAYGCLDTARAYVEIRPEFLFFMPNSFTPDNDGLNDVVRPVMEGFKGDSYTWRIFDRWGDVVFESHDPNEYWTGNKHGGEYYVKTEVYYWEVIVGTVVSVDSIKKNGHITVLR